MYSELLQGLWSVEQLGGRAKKPVTSQEIFLWNIVAWLNYKDNQVPMITGKTFSRRCILVEIIYFNGQALPPTYSKKYWGDLYTANATWCSDSSDVFFAEFCEKKVCFGITFSLLHEVQLVWTQMQH